MQNDEAVIKINSKYLVDINNENINKYFGEWINNVDELNKSFISGLPFENIVIDNFLSEEYVNKIYNSFPTNYDNWYKYINPIEFKYTFDKIETLEEDIQK